jgi:DNA-binding NarL/FixJ family response regulator
MHVLYISPAGRDAGWLNSALSCDSASDVVLEEAAGMTAGVSRLREEVFDAVLLHHDGGPYDVLDLVEALRAGGSEEALVVLGTGSESEMSVLCYEAGADAYLTVTGSTTRNLLWIVARAIERQKLIRDNRRLSQAERRRHALEQTEAVRGLESQRAIAEVTSTSRHASPDDGDFAPVAQHASRAPSGEPELPAQLKMHYRELLRAYVIMGSGNLVGDMATLADLLAGAGVSPQQVLQMHLGVLEEMLSGLGSRSARHVMHRADLLVLEVTVQLAEAYRRRSRTRHVPASGIELDAEPVFAESSGLLFDRDG